MRRLVPAFALLLAACNTEAMWEKERAEKIYAVPPTAYRTDIVAFMRTYLNDPSGVREALVSEPAQRDYQGLSRYTSCVRYNAKKSGGQYAGSKDSFVLFRDGRLDRVIDNGRELCKDAAYVPFPELERLTR